MYDLGTGALTRQQSELLKTQQQMASGRRILTAADDPAGASEALRVSQALATSRQTQANQKAASDTLSVAESTLGQVGDVLQSIQQRLLQGQNGTLSANERSAIASDVDNMLGSLISLSNTKDARGAYLFGGFAEATIPFVKTPTGVVYQGDDGGRSLEVASGRNLAISSAGSEVFMRIKNGNGVFSTAASGGNSGAGVIDSGTVVNPSALSGHAYTLTFSGGPGNLTYDVYDNTAGTPVSTGNAFTSGQSIVVAGMQFTITGNPVSGDSFTAQPSANQSMFKTIADAIAALRANGTASVRTSQLNAAMASLDQAMNHTNAARAEFGSRMNEIDAHSNVADQVVLEDQKRLSDLQDLDYTSAASSLTRQQTATQAAQQSFANIAKLNLFNYLG